MFADTACHAPEAPFAELMTLIKNPVVIIGLGGMASLLAAGIIVLRRKP